MSKSGNMTLVVGNIGSGRLETGTKLAEKKGLPLMVLDGLIEKEDGRTVRYICMSRGEHEYRNKEYEMLEKLHEEGAEGVIVCGDGVLLDDMSREIIEKHEVTVADKDTDPEILWEAMKNLDPESTYHAFMMKEDPEERHMDFLRIYHMRKRLFESYPAAEEEDSET